MSGTKRESFIVRILDQNNNPVGAGFLISPRHVLTCDHLILKLGKEIKEITLDFPLMSQRIYKASIKKQIPLNEQAGIGDIEDIAILELLSHEELPDGANPAPVSEIDNLFDHPVSVCGFPEGKNDGSWVDGELKGPTAKGWIQFDQEIHKECVKPGFSGTAVWDKNAEAVVGMVVSVDRTDTITTTYMIPASKLIKAWPELGRQTKTEDYYKFASERRPPPSRISFLPYMSDRVPQAAQLELTLDKCEDCLHEKPLVCIIHGDEIECHDKFIKRLHEVELPEILNEPGKIPVDLTMVEWPSLKEEIKMRCKKLMNNMSRALTGNRRADPEEIKKVLNRKISPQMIYFTLPVAAWEKNEVELIIYWLQYWNGFPKLNDGRKLMVFLCIKYKHIPDSNAEGAENYRNRNDAARNFINSLRYEEYANIVGLTFDELKAVEWSDVDMWITKNTEKFRDDTELRTEAMNYYESRQNSPVPMLELAKILNDLIYADQRKEENYV